MNGYLLELQLNFNIKWKQILSIVSIILNQAKECKFRVTTERSYHQNQLSLQFNNSASTLVMTH